MNKIKFLGACALSLLLAGGYAVVQAEDSGSGGGDGQAAPEASGSEATTVFPEVLPGAVSADIWEVKCVGKNTSIGARVCDAGALDDTFDVSIVGYAPGAVLNNGDRGFLRRGSFGGCTFEAFTERQAGKPGSIKAYVTVSQQGGSGSGYNLSVTCYGPANAVPTGKLIRDAD